MFWCCSLGYWCYCQLQETKIRNISLECCFLRPVRTSELFSSGAFRADGLSCFARAAGQALGCRYPWCNLSARIMSPHLRRHAGLGDFGLMELNLLWGEEGMSGLCHQTNVHSFWTHFKCSKCCLRLTTVNTKSQISDLIILTNDVKKLIFEMKFQLAVK